MFEVLSPESADQFAQYYDLRWRVLREPWQQPRGAEKDEWEDNSSHRMILNEAGQVVAVGRIHYPDTASGQIRYMAVAEDYRGKGLASKLLSALHLDAEQKGVQRIDLNAREDAVALYHKAGYLLLGDGHTLYGEVKHLRMSKMLQEPDENALNSAAVKLQSSWQQGIPISDKMGIHLTQFEPQQVDCQASFANNINVHQTMFAGSINALATLTGWGMVHLLLLRFGLQGDIVLANANISYKRPIKATPMATAMLADCCGDILTLQQGENARLNVTVTVTGGAKPAAIFSGEYVVIAKKA